MAQVARTATEPGVGGAARARPPAACTELEIMDDAEREEWQGQMEVRNTFLHGRLARSPSLEAFYREREVSSCPGCKSGCLEGLFHEDAAVVRDQSGQSSASDGTTETPALSPRSGWSETECQQVLWPHPAAVLPPAPVRPPVLLHAPAAVPPAPCPGPSPPWRRGGPTLVRLADSLLAGGPDAAGPHPGARRAPESAAQPPASAAPGSEESFPASAPPATASGAASPAPLCTARGARMGPCASSATCAIQAKRSAGSARSSSAARRRSGSAA
ncbi:unnamed protein product [Prorocentrum cordatum]|uniref:Uncharacterized protein n=1 Tax=Prorocentrum cordatum TaxID=2364126 RepID=A0ABN9UZX5_9DINO|nr:unnamed protein product [Polarella glacialis]